MRRAAWIIEHLQPIQRASRGRGQHEIVAGSGDADVEKTRVFLHGPPPRGLPQLRGCGVHFQAGAGAGQSIGPGPIADPSVRQGVAPIECPIDFRG